MLSLVLLFIDHPCFTTLFLLPIFGAALNHTWFGGDSPGVAISGDSGCGKTSTINLLLSTFLRCDPVQPFIYIDPTGNSVAFLQRIVADLPERLQKKFIIIRPSDLSKVCSINPLHVSRDDCSQVEWQARVTTKVAHVVRILLAAWGEVDLNSRPRLFTWLYRILKSLACCGMTIPDSRYFLDPRDPVFLSIVRAVQDPIARRAFEDLACRRPADADEQIESARTRLLGFCESVVVQLVLGRSDADVLDMRQAILDGKIILIDLKLGGTLRDEDQAIFANLFLTDFLFTVMNMPAQQRRRYVVCLDELPLFANKGSGPLLMRSVREVRQFLVRYIFAFQGKEAFDDPRFINLILSQLGTLMAMRHTGFDDAGYIGSHLALPSYSPHKVKHVQRQLIQYQDGHELHTLVDEGENWGTAEQQGTANAVGSTEENTATHNRTITETGGRTTHPYSFDSVNDAVNRARATAEGGATARSTGTKTMSTTNHSTTTNQGGSKTYKQSLVPKIVNKTVITGVTFLTPEEQVMQAAGRLSRLRNGEAAIYVSGKGVFYVRFPLLKDPFHQTPKFAAKKLRRLEEQQHALPYYRTPQEILEQREVLLRETLIELDRSTLTAASAQQRLEHSILLPKQTEDAGRPMTPDGYPEDDTEIGDF